MPVPQKHSNMPTQPKASILSQQKQLASSPETSPEQLRELAATGSKAICERVAANPNTPKDVLLKLGAKFPQQLLENPVLPLLLLENPNFIEEIPLNTLIKILKEKQVPDYILNIASKYEDENILILVASNINTCRVTLEYLAQSRYPKVQQIAKLNVNFAGEIQECWEEIAIQAIFSFNDEKIYEVNLHDLAIAQLIPDYLLPALPNSIIHIIALHPNTPIYVFELLCTNKFDYIVHKSVALNPKTPVILLETLAKYYKQIFCEILDSNSPDKFGAKEVLSAIARNPNTPINLLEELYQIPSQSVLRAIAENKNASVKMLDFLASSIDEYTRARVAKNPNLSISTLKTLCLDQDVWVRVNATENVNIPVDLLELLATDKESKVRMRVAGHVNTSKRALEILAQDESEWVRCSVAINPNTTTNILSDLANEKSNSVRYHIALNSNAPTSLLKKLAQDTNFLVRQAVASNSNTPLYILKKLAIDENLKVQLGVATNLNTQHKLINTKLTQEYPQELAENSATPTSILTALAQHPYRRVRMSIAKNKSTPIEALEILAKDKVDNVRHTAARNPNMFIDKFAKITLERIAKTTVPSFSRFIVFLHPEVPQEALVKNYRSPLWLEKYAIAQNPNTPKHIKSELTLDANQLVRAAAKATLE